MSEEIIQGNDILAELQALDMNNVDTSYPQLKDGIYPFTIAEMKIVDQKAPKKGKNIAVKLVAVGPMPTTDGKGVNPGFVVNTQFSLTPTEKYDPRPGLARFREAVTGSKSGLFLPLEQYIGATVNVRVAGESTDEYGTQNRVKSFVKKA